MISQVFLRNQDEIYTKFDLCELKNIAAETQRSSLPIWYIYLDIQNRTFCIIHKNKVCLYIHIHTYLIFNDDTM